jgi:hypothetical protein
LYKKTELGCNASKDAITSKCIRNIGTWKDIESISYTSLNEHLLVFLFKEIKIPKGDEVIWEKILKK